MLLLQNFLPLDNDGNINYIMEEYGFHSYYFTRQFGFHEELEKIVKSCQRISRLVNLKNRSCQQP